MSIKDSKVIGIKAPDAAADKPPVRPRGPMGGPPGMAGMAAGDKPKDFKGAFSKLIHYLAAYRLALLVVLIFSIGSTIFAIMGPDILARAIDKLIEGIMGKIANTQSSIDFSFIGAILMQLVMLYLASSVFSYVQGFIMSGVAMKVSYRFRQDISTKISRMPLRYFDNQSHGDVLSRVTNDVDTVRACRSLFLP
jgi:ATP-binding cassette subfamily B multidrug efflux pump